jgi:hypothetical protein
MDLAKRFFLMALLSFVAVYFHDALRLFLVVLESIPHLILAQMSGWLGSSAFMDALLLAITLIITTALYSGVLLGGYWLVNRRIMLHYGALIFVVWFVVLVVMTIGPKALAL